mmetsp:Transcript_59836/g.110798  ORF Transcript_59836/g.110798 Transcript_59836/m.110798 type:complete len:125 (+) Transcript_59836:40-414(+)
MAESEASCALHYDRVLEKHVARSDGCSTFGRGQASSMLLGNDGIAPCGIGGSRLAPPPPPNNCLGGPISMSSFDGESLPESKDFLVAGVGFASAVGSTVKPLNRLWSAAGSPEEVAGSPLPSEP